MSTISEFSKVLIRPVLTEKSTRLQGQGKYVFEVPLEANKGLVKQAVERLFNVDVVRVQTMHVRGKRKRMGIRVVKHRDWKKAIVSLKPGQKLQIFEGV